MGNKFSACGCGQEPLNASGESPNCRKIKKNLVKFWAEIFLLAQDGNSHATKWQIVVPKLVPINLARVQESPAIVSQITAYNTKVDKVMDTLIYYPGIDLFRGSDCFVYWCDPQKGLTWGLNFISAEDASYFLEVVCGKSRGGLNRRANSTQSLTEKGQQNGKQQKATTSSTPATPDIQHQTRRPTVTFAEVPTTFSANSLATTSRTVSSSNDHIQHLHEELVTAAAGWIGKPSVISPRDPRTSSPVIVNHCTGVGNHCNSGLVNHSNGSLVNHGVSGSVVNHNSSGVYDNLTNLASLISSDLATHCAQIENDVWQRQSNLPNETTMHMSLDSNTLKRMIDPLPNAGNRSKILSNSMERLQTLNGQSPVMQSRQVHGRSSSFRQGHGYRNHVQNGQQNNSSPNRFIVSSTPSCSSSMSATSVDTGTYTIGPKCTDVMLKQNDRHFNVVSTPKNKRCSIYLNTNTAKINAKNGEPVLMSVKDLAGDDSNSLNSSLDGSTSSQSSHANEINGLKPSPTNNKIKKAGHIVMKKWLQPHENGIEILSVENWKRFWCCLKGYCINFYNVLPSNSTDIESLSRSNGVEELCLSSDPVMTIDLLNCLAQALPEYPRREHVFCLNTGSGQSFLLQVANDAEVDNWIQTIHTAGAMALARTQSRDMAQKSVRKELEKLEQKLDAVNKMVKLSQLPTSIGTVTTYQLDEWEEELELLHVQHFMVKCYWAALKCQDSPSCKKMLTSATKTTKAHLSRLGAFTSSSMHAYVLVKSSGKMRSSCSSPIRQQVVQDHRQQFHNNNNNYSNATTTSTTVDERSATPQSVNVVGTPGKLFKSRASLVQITLPNQQVTVVSVGDMETVATVLQKACEKASLKVDKCFLLLRRITTPGESHVPNDNEILQPKIATHQVEIRERLAYHVHLGRIDAQDRIFGLTIRAQKQPNKSRMTITITNVDENGLAKRAGLIIGDELLAINGQHVSFLISSEIEQILQESPTLCLVLRTKRIALPVWLEPMNYAGSNESLKLTCSNNDRSVCGVVRINNAILPEDEEESENWFSDSCNMMQNKIRLRNNYRTASLSVRGRQRLSLPVIPTGAGLSPVHRDSVSAHSSPNHFDQQRNSAAANIMKRISSSEPGNIMSTGYNGVGASRSSSIKVGTTERLEKILFELVETEKAYVKDLETLMQIYLQPMQNERLLPMDDLERLLVSCFAIIKFQRSFLEELLEVVGAENNQQPLTYSSPSHLRNALLHLGGVFLTSASGFKVYSSFCAAYFRFAKILRSEEQNENLQRFLLTCNVKRQHSATLESYLIKPVQRVLRYPLFLQQLKSLTNPHQPEHTQISDALLKMEKVAEYINEMQRIYEEYGPLFSQIQLQNRHIQDTSFELCDLLMFGEVDWLNSNEEQNKKKLVPMECLCFVFKSAILLMSQDNKRQRKPKGNNGEKQTMYRFIPINELEINGSDVGSSDSRFIWILIHIDPVLRIEKVYHFANKRQEAKQQFLKAVRRAGVLMAKQNGSQKNSSFKSTLSPCRSTAAILASKNAQVLPVNQIGGLTPGDFNAKTKRPTSYHSNQSDPGYGSSTNGEMQKRLM